VSVLVRQVKTRTEVRRVRESGRRRERKGKRKGYDEGRKDAGERRENRNGQRAEKGDSADGDSAKTSAGRLAGGDGGTQKTAAQEKGKCPTAGLATASRGKKNGSSTEEENWGDRHNRAEPEGSRRVGQFRCGDNNKRDKLADLPYKWE
jgi:hypothetical protein